MSTKIATSFGEVYQDDYHKVISKWSKKFSSRVGVNPKTRSEWGSDLQNFLGNSVITALMDHTLPRWSKVGTLPPKEVLDMYAKIAAKGALAVDTGDLFQRLKDASVTVLAAVQAPELVKRASQTVSQIFDMAQDRFNSLLGKNFQNTDQATGDRMWVITPSKFGPSRHASLDGVVRAEDELFDVDGEEVYGPRPPGGDPAQWSNCSCRILYQSGDDWV